MALKVTRAHVDRHGITPDHAQTGRQLAVHKHRVQTEQGIEREFLLLGRPPSLSTEDLQQVQPPHQADAGLPITRFKDDGLCKIRMDGPDVGMPAHPLDEPFIDSALCA